jgi:hypothetical protein
MNIHNCIRCNNPINYDDSDWCEICDMSIFDDKMVKQTGMLEIRNIKRILDVHLTGTDYMIKNVCETLDKSKSIPYYYEIQLYSHQSNYRCRLILDKQREYTLDRQPYYSLHLELDLNTLMPSFAIHPKDMDNANAFIYCVEQYFKELYRNNYLKQ